MVKNILYILTLLLTVSSFSQTINQTDTQGRKQGKWQKNYENSKVPIYIGQFKNDRPIGTFYYYYPSTKKKAIIQHDEKTPRSAAYMFHENGVLIAFGIYQNQEKDSVWTHFGPSGRLSYKETYKKGKLNGEKTIYYVPEDPNDKSARVARIEHYQDDIRHGSYIEYFDTGAVKGTGNYERGKLIGKITSNHPNGKPMIMEQYKYGNRHGWAFGYDENGGQTGKRYFKFGRELTGTELEEWMEDCKSRGVNPND